MKKRLLVLVLPIVLLLGLAPPSQASISISPGSLDFGSFPSTSPPRDLLYANVTISADEVNKYATGIKMLSGEKSFVASSNCIETSRTPGQAVQCTVGVRYEPGEFGTTFGLNSGVIGISFGPNEGTPVETKEIPVTATVTTANTPPPTTTGPGNGHKPKKKCKKGKHCGKHRGKGKR